MISYPIKILGLIILGLCLSFCGKKLGKPNDVKVAGDGTSQDAVGYKYASVCSEEEPADEAKLLLTPEMPNYQDDIAPLVGPTCAGAGCHAAVNPAANLNLTTSDNVINSYALILDRVQRNAGEAGLMPPAGRLDQTVLDMLVKWQADNFPLVPPVPEEPEEEEPEEKPEEEKTPEEATSTGGTADSENIAKVCVENEEINSADNWKLFSDALSSDRFKSCQDKNNFYDRRKDGTCIDADEIINDCSFDTIRDLFTEFEKAKRVIDSYESMFWKVDQCVMKDGLPMVSIIKLSHIGEKLIVNTKVLKFTQKSEGEER